MGCRVITGTDECGSEVDLLYCSTTGIPFGAVFYPDNGESAVGFLEWLKGSTYDDDPRRLGLCHINGAWRNTLTEAIDHYRASLQPAEDE